MATFKEAFREARKAGKKTFMWNGKPYTTELKEEAEARKSKTKPSKPAAPSAAAKATGRRRPDETARAAEDEGFMSRLRKAGLTPSGASEVGAGKSALAALGMAGGVAARGVGKALSAAPKSGVSRAEAAIERVVGGRRAPTAAARTEPRVGRPATTRLDDAAAAFSKPRAAEMSKETGRRFTPKQEREAAEAAVRGAAARKKMAETRAGRSRAMEEAKKESMMRADKKKPSPRSRTRDEEDIEFAKGGYAAKGKK